MAIIVETWMAEDLATGTQPVNRTHASGGNLPGHQISLSSFSLAGASGTATSQAWSDLTTINPGSFQSKDVTVPGASLGDFVLASLDLDTQDMLFTYQVTADNTVTCTLYNPTTAAITLAATGTLRVLVFETR
jgi:hypothetical protein